MSRPHLTAWIDPHGKLYDIDWDIGIRCPLPGANCGEHVEWAATYLLPQGVFELHADIHLMALGWVRLLSISQPFSLVDAIINVQFHRGSLERGSLKTITGLICCARNPEVYVDVGDYTFPVTGDMRTVKDGYHFMEKDKAIELLRQHINHMAVA